MNRGPLRCRALLSLSATLLTFLLATGVSDATYTGYEQLITVGAAAAGAGWIAVPEFTDSSDPGTITGVPYNTTVAALAVARVTGPGRIAFRSEGGGLEKANARAIAAASAHSVVIAWTTGDQIETATLGPSGTLTHLLSTPGSPNPGSLRLAVGPDGAYAIQWTDATGQHADAVSAGGDAFEPLLAADATIPAGDSVLLAGGDAAWLVGRGATGVAAAPITIGQSAAPALVPVLPGAATATLADDRGNLWILGRDGVRWRVARVDRAGHLSTFALRRGASGAVIALAPGRALLSYRGPDCHTYLQPLPVDAPRLGPPLDLTMRARQCSAPAGLAADPATGTAYALVRSARVTRLVVARRLDVTTWPGKLTGRVVALQATGSNRVLIETSGRPRDIGEQCGGADDSFSTPITLRVFGGARLERTGSLSALEYHC